MLASTCWQCAPPVASQYPRKPPSRTSNDHRCHAQVRRHRWADWTLQVQWVGARGQAHRKRNRRGAETTAPQVSWGSCWMSGSRASTPPAWSSIVAEHPQCSPRLASPHTSCTRNANHSPPPAPPRPTAKKPAGHGGGDDAGAKVTVNIPPRMLKVTAELGEGQHGVGFEMWWTPACCPIFAVLHCLHRRR